jgi:gluconolactonase
MSTQVIADGLGFTEGPVWLSDHRVAVTSISHGCVYIIDPAGGAQEKITTGGGPNGLAVGDDGTLYVAQNGGIFGASGPAEPGVQVIRDGRVDYLTRGLDAPNDLVIGPDGRLWVTDTRYEVDFFNPDETRPGRVWAIDTSTGGAELALDGGPVFINGLGFTPDGARLLVTSTALAQLVAYPRDSLSPADAEVVCTFEAGWPDGITMGSDGDCWVALTGGHRLDRVSSAGEVVASVALPAGSLPTNVCFGGEHLDELLVTASFHGAVLCIQV